MMLQCKSMIKMIQNSMHYEMLQVNKHEKHINIIQTN